MIDPSPTSAGEASTRGGGAASVRARAKGVFLEAIESPESERGAVLARACAGDERLLAEVKSLLSAFERSASGRTRATRPGFTGGAGGGAGSVTGGAFDLIGRTVGRYVVLERLGEGGFGEVYRAEQTEPVRRMVALKILKPGMDSRAVIARFEQERQALALMDHPHIARVLDAGQTDAGRPYFVMELVRGAPITEHCDTNRLGLTERLRLFREVCLAVQHAHQKGVIHRDIKPSNVMVTVADGRATPKVIDFGIAKATGARLTDHTLFTDFRVLLGTPEYMSPEQAEGSAGGGPASGPGSRGGLDIDTRSDIYSLGVLLYELLTGTTPLDRSRLRSLSLSAIQRAIREEEPPRPSTRLAGLTRGAGGTRGAAAAAEAIQAVETIARQRGTEAAALTRRLRGDLDWIVMKAMDKDRSRRYESAAALATDIDRHLRHETVSASPPSAGYRLAKLVRRHRGAFAAGAVVAGALVVGLALSLYGLLQAAAERDEKEAARVAEAEQKIAAVRAAEQAQRRAYRASIAAAQAALQLGDGATAARTLEAAPEGLRAWEWRYLSNHVERSRRRLALGGDGLTHATLDGEYALLSSAGRLELLNWVTGVRTGVELTPGEGTMALAVSPRGDRFLVCAYRGTTLYDAEGRVIRFFADGPRFERDAFTPDGSEFVLSEPAPSRVTVFDARTGAALRSAPIDVSRRAFPAVSADGRWIASEVGNDLVGVLDARTLEEVRRVPGTMPRFTPDSASLLVIERPDQGARLVRRRIADGSIEATLDVSTIHFDRMGGRGRVLEVSPDGHLVAIARQEGSVAIHDAATFRPIHLLNTSSPSSLFSLLGVVGFSRDGTQLAKVSSDMTLHVWDTAIGGDPLCVPATTEVAASCAAVSPDGRRVASGDWGRMLVWDAETGEPLWTTFHALEYIFGISFSPDGRLIAAAGDRGTVWIVDAATGRLVRQSVPMGYGAFGANVLTTACWRGEEEIVVGAKDGWVIGLRSRDLSIAWRARLGDPAARVARVACPPGRYTGPIVAVAGGRAWRLDPESPGTPPRDLGVAGARSAAWSADGQRAAIGADGAAWVVEVQTAGVTEFAEASGAFSAMTFSPDGRRVVGASSHGALRVWDAVTGDLVADLPVPFAGTSSAIGFTPDGASLVTQTSTFAVIRFESQPPSGATLHARETVRRARDVLARLRPEAPDAPTMARRLEAEPASDIGVRAMASRINSVLGDHAAACNNGAFSMSARPTDPDTLRRALRLSDLAMAMSSDPYILNVRAMIFYRTGRTSEALDLLGRAESGYRATRPGMTAPPAMLAALRFLCRHAIAPGTGDPADVAVLEAHCADHPADEYARGWLDEVRAIVAPSASGR